MGFYFNIVKNIDRTPYYLNVVNPTLDNISKISSFDPMGRYVDTFVNTKYMKNIDFATNLNGVNYQLNALLPLG